MQTDRFNDLKARLQAARFTQNVAWLLVDRYEV